MAMLARRFAKAFPVAYEARSKAERGYALAEGTLADVVSARPAKIDPAMTTADAFTTIGLECLRHVACNEIAVRHSDPDGIHQMRVGLRRLRAASSLFKEMLDDRETHRIKVGLVWLTEQLGPARDYEVMVSESIDPLLEQHPNRACWRAISSTSATRATLSPRQPSPTHGTAISSSILRSGCSTASGGEITMRLKPRCASGRCPPSCGTS